MDPRRRQHPRFVKNTFLDWLKFPELKFPGAVFYCDWNAFRGGSIRSWCRPAIYVSVLGYHARFTTNVGCFRFHRSPLSRHVFGEFAGPSVWVATFSIPRTTVATTCLSHCLRWARAGTTITTIISHRHGRDLPGGKLTSVTTSWFCYPRWDWSGTFALCRGKCGMELEWAENDWLGGELARISHKDRRERSFVLSLSTCDASPYHVRGNHGKNAFVLAE